MADDIKAAVTECIKAREKAAAPLTFNAEALKVAERSDAWTVHRESRKGWRMEEGRAGAR